MITGVILARNEEANIIECLQALRPHVAEVLLIDMESDDRTVELARPLVDKIVTHPIVPAFDAARNVAIDRARHDWLWFVDADERVPNSTGSLVNRVIREHGDQFTSMLIPFRTHFCGRPIKHCGWWPGYTMPRVLKRGHFRFSEMLHGGVETEGVQIRIPADERFAIEHFSYLSVEHYLSKVNRYTTVEAQQMQDAGRRWSWQGAIRHMMRDLWLYYEANQGRLDGAHGWVLSWLSGQYRWLSHAKLWDISQARQGTATLNKSVEYPQSLDEVLAVMEGELDALRRGGQSGGLEGVIWRSPLLDASGYAEDGRTQVKALASGRLPLHVSQIRWSDTETAIPASERSLFSALQRTKRLPHAAAITSCIPSVASPDPAAVINILRTMFETDRIPEFWLPHIGQYDEVWVLSQQNYESFRRSGVPAERIRIAPGCIDTDAFCPTGAKLPRPESLKGRFVFLSVFDWQLRKGWDVLLRAYCRAFDVADAAGLWLKIGSAIGYPIDEIRRQANEVLQAIGQRLDDRPDIVLHDAPLSSQALSAMYRAADAFVLPSRGEGWGRPFMEAMACGLPVIGTYVTGNAGFMNESNSLVVPCRAVDVPEAAAKEIPVYRGHRWQEPDEEALRNSLRTALEDVPRRQAIAARGLADVSTKFNLEQGRKAIEDALLAAEKTWLPPPPAPISAEDIRVAWEGEFFAGHSFSNINEKIALELAHHPGIGLSLQRVVHNPTYDAESLLAPRLRHLMNRDLPGGPEITVRHAFPPYWEKPAQGLWIHIQPWEFGYLPLAWAGPLRHEVDEIWAPSQYVRKVYERSQVPSEKIHVIPWGIDPTLFNPQAPPLHLPTEKSFRFLFVGGTIHRKGFDLLLEAYLQEFSRAEDVCLVVKDVGVDSFYRFGNCRQQVFEAMQDSTRPSIVYLDRRFTEGQLASLNTACQCLVAPYRGEGFGMPILEAMACGLPPIVTSGGASDDFADESTAFVLPSQEVASTSSEPQCGPAVTLNVSIADLRRSMRQAVENRELTRALGASASRRVLQSFTWGQTVARMAERIRQLARGQHHVRSSSDMRTTAPEAGRIALPDNLSTAGAA